jgi:hypothetical protein
VQDRGFRIFGGPFDPKQYEERAALLLSNGYDPDLGNGPSPGTRYFNSTQVIALEVSQSQTSVPSRSMARIQ